jgi:hypothetical protein
MSNPECYKLERQYEETTKTWRAAADDLNSTSPNASPFVVRSARLKTTKREQTVARENLIEHRRSCSDCKAKGVPE